MTRLLALETFPISAHWSSAALTICLVAILGHMTELLTLVALDSLVVAAVISRWSVHLFIGAILRIVAVALTIVAADACKISGLASLSSFSVLRVIFFEIIVANSVRAAVILSRLGAFEFLMARLVAIEACLVLHL